MDLWVEMQQVHGVGDGGGGGVVAGEDEGLDAVDGHVSEGTGHSSCGAASLLIPGYFLLVRIQREIHDRAFPILLFRGSAVGFSLPRHPFLPRRDFLVNLRAQQTIQFPLIPPQANRADEIDVVKGTDGRRRRHHDHLITKSAHDRVRAFLAVKV